MNALGPKGLAYKPGMFNVLGWVLGSRGDIPVRLQMCHAVLDQITLHTPDLVHEH